MSRDLSSSVDRRPVRILKFGGTSVGSPDMLRRGIQIIQKATERCRPVVVVSAAGGVTDMLVEAADGAPHSTNGAERWTDRIGTRYRRLARAVIESDSLQSEYVSTLQSRLSTLAGLLENVAPLQSAARDAVLATGEQLMTPLLAAALTSAGRPARSVDATGLIRTNGSHGEAVVDWEQSRTQIREWHGQRVDESIPIVTGFIGSTGSSTTTTLGRGGSDYSAALLARALDAECLERWSDVEGLYTCDPAENGDAELLSHIALEQARKWTKNGRLGLHPRTLDPLAAASIPIHVRCTHRPEASGTKIVPSVSTSGR